MDQFCIARGTLFDNSSVVTLEGPDQHSVHCLVDVPDCVGSLYEILNEPAEGETMYTRSVVVNAAGRDLLRDLARSAGDPNPSGTPGCTTCTGGGTVARGFRAAVRGRLLDLGSFDTPAMIEIIEAQPSMGPDSAICELTPLPIGNYGVASEATEPPATGNVFTLEDGKVVISFDVDQDADTLSVQFVLEGQGWVSVGYSPDGRMVGATAVIGLPDEAVASGTNPSLYFLSSRDEAGVQRLPADAQTLLDADVTQNDTHTVLGFTRALVENDVVNVDLNAANTFVYAYGSTNGLGFHASREVLTVANFLDGVASPPMLQIGDEVCVEGFGK